jgi:TetR/AcrR family transcriptional regulator, transcriptional repressor for nem operon
MARPKEFDEATVLATAVQQFWVHGYEATSIRDLATTMGIANASLYNAFRDKRSLFRRSLEYYIERSAEELWARAEMQLSPLQVIRSFFEKIIDFSLNDPQRKGCLMVNSALEVAPHDPDIQQVIADLLVKVETGFRLCIEAGQASGEISRSQSAADLARHLLGLVMGIRVLARVRPERALLEGLVRPSFAMLVASQEPSPNTDKVSRAQLRI